MNDRNRIVSHIFIDVKGPKGDEDDAKTLARCAREFCEREGILAEEIIVTPRGGGEFRTEIYVEDSDSIDAEKVFTMLADIFEDELENGHKCTCGGNCENCKCK